jgi:Trypsin-like peptidase domain
VEILVLTDEEFTLPFIPDEMRKCVVYLGYRMADGSERLAGSAFFLARPVQPGTPEPTSVYIITARHVIDGIRKKGLDTVLVRTNMKPGILPPMIWVDTNVSDWVSHNDNSVDVAVFKVKTWNHNFDHIVFPLASCDLSTFHESEKIAIGEEVFIIGLFSGHHGKKKNIPIVRIGNIAAVPEEPVVTDFAEMSAYLIEGRSIGGISGSPVFFDTRGFRRGKYYAGGQKFHLLGLIHGHFDIDAANIDAVIDDGQEKANVNMGIAIVVPSDKIIEVVSYFADAEKRDMEAQKQTRTPRTTTNKF